LSAFWQGSLSGALLAGAVGALLGAGLTLWVMRMQQRKSRTAEPAEQSVRDDSETTNSQ
jgi:uncharacterized protein (DUF2062 family)